MCFLNLFKSNKQQEIPSVQHNILCNKIHNDDFVNKLIDKRNKISDKYINYVKKSIIKDMNIGESSNYYKTWYEFYGYHLSDNTIVEERLNDIFEDYKLSFNYDDSNFYISWNVKNYPCPTYSEAIEAVRELKNELR